MKKENICKKDETIVPSMNRGDEAGVLKMYSLYKVSL